MKKEEQLKLLIDNKPYYSDTEFRLLKNTISNPEHDDAFLEVCRNYEKVRWASEEMQEIQSKIKLGYPLTIKEEEMVRTTDIKYIIRKKL